MGHYAAVTRKPQYVVRGQSQTLYVPIYDGTGTLATVSSGTAVLLDDDGDTVASATIGNDATNGASFAVDSADVPSSLSFSALYSVEWPCTLSDGKFLRIKQRAALVDAEPVMPIDGSRLSSVHPELADQLTTQQWHDAASEAWDDLLARMIEDGHVPQQVLSMDSLAKCQRNWGLWYAMRLLATFTSGRGRYAEYADDYETLADKDYAAMRWVTDTDQDGTPETGSSSTYTLLGLPEGPELR